MPLPSEVPEGDPPFGGKGSAWGGTCRHSCRSGVLRPLRAGQPPQPSVPMTSFHQQTCTGVAISLSFPFPRYCLWAHQNALTLLMDVPTFSCPPSKDRPLGVPEDSDSSEYGPCLHSCLRYFSSLFPQWGRQALPQTVSNSARGRTQKLTLLPFLEDSPAPQVLSHEQSPRVKEEATV